MLSERWHRLVLPTALVFWFRVIVYSVPMGDWVGIVGDRIENARCWTRNVKRLLSVPVNEAQQAAEALSALLSRRWNEASNCLRIRRYTALFRRVPPCFACLEHVFNGLLNLDYQ